MHYTEIESIEQFISKLNETSVFEHVAFQHIDFSNHEESMLKSSFKECIFLGCTLSEKSTNSLIQDNSLFPRLNVPFNCYPAQLYTTDVLYNNYKAGDNRSYKNTYDSIVYAHYVMQGKEADSIKETLARRLHDHAITDAMYDFISQYEEKKIVAIMGGHAILRTDKEYKQVAILAKQLCEQGYLLVTGGGPGAMEATHLGVWFGNSSDAELAEALQILAIAPAYNDKNWLDCAFRVIKNHTKRNNFESLGIPTWLYGHEPATPFATKIAKYFANSVREDGLLTIAKGGVIFSPGSAGTVQEIFQDATQNHYKSFGYASPMIFWGNDFWTKQFPVYNFIKQSLTNGNYKNLLLSVTDKAQDVIQTLNDFSS